MRNYINISRYSFNWSENVIFFVNVSMRNFYVSRLLTISLVPVKNGDSFTSTPTFLPLCEGQSTLAFVIRLVREIRNVSSPRIRVGWGRMGYMKQSKCHVERIEKNTRSV